MVPNIETIIISAGVTMLSLGLLVVSLLSYRKYKNTKLLLISLVFIFFFIRGILLSISVFVDNFAEMFLTGFSVGLFDFIMLVLLFIATLKK